MSIEKLAQALKAHKGIVFTGAGVSTNSGIPDFRSTTGFYQKYHEDDLAIDAFFNKTDQFYTAFQDKFSSVFKANPNETHTILAELEALGYLSGIITQNVDRLHQRAGSTVIEFHGNIFHYDLIQVLNPSYHHYNVIEENIHYSDISTDDHLNYRLDKDIIYKPKVVLFGEGISQYESSAYLAKTHLVHIIIGTSFQVSPFNMVSYENKNPNLKVFLINNEPIDYYNAHCDYTEIIGDTSDILKKLKRILNDKNMV